MIKTVDVVRKEKINELNSKLAKRIIATVFSFLCVIGIIVVFVFSVNTGEPSLISAMSFLLIIFILIMAVSSIHLSWQTANKLKNFQKQLFLDVETGDETIIKLQPDNTIKVKEAFVTITSEQGSNLRVSKDTMIWMDIKVENVAYMLALHEIYISVISDDVLIKTSTIWSYAEESLDLIV